MPAVREGCGRSQAPWTSGQALAFSIGATNVAWTLSITSRETKLMKRFRWAEEHEQ
jgi:hypothetical protein